MDDETVQTPDWRAEAEAARIERDRERDLRLELDRAARTLGEERDEERTQRAQLAEKCERLEERREELFGLLTAVEVENDRLRAVIEMPEDVAGLRCPFCPFCGDPPAFILVGAVQAFCRNDDCKVMIWNPSETAAKNLHDMGEVDMKTMERGTKGATDG